MATLWLSAREAEVIKAEAGIPTARSTSLADAVAEFLEEHRPPIWSEGWHSTVGLWWRARLIPGLGGPDIQVSEVTRDQVASLRARWLHSDASPIKPPTVNRLTAIGSGFYKWAVDRGYALENPFRGHRHFAETKADPPTLGEEDLARFLAAFTDPVLQRAATIEADTGLRRSELERVRWADLEGRTLRVISSYERGQTKTKTPRRVPLTDRALAALKAQHEAHPGALVFGPLPEYRKAMLAAQAASGLPRFRWHDLRHFALTRAANAGALGHDLKAMAGWKSLAMADRYIHGDVRRLESVIDRMNECAQGVRPTPPKPSKTAHNRHAKPLELQDEDQ